MRLRHNHQTGVPNGRFIALSNRCLMQQGEQEEMQHILLDRKRSNRAEKPSPHRTLGPVSDLERHLPSDWWRTLFTAMYLKTDGDIVENDNNTRHDIDLVTRAAGLEPNDNILDLCCGQGRHTIELARRGFRRLTGVDRSRYLTRLARKRARADRVAVTFHEGDARKFKPPSAPYHCVMLLGNSFGYFDQLEDDEAVLQNVSRLLIPHGVAVLDLVDGEWMKKNFEARSWEWIDDNHFVNRERSLTSDHQRLVTRELISHAEKGVLADQFYAERLYSRDDIRNLLTLVGFEDIMFHKPPKTHSDRGQDLGMLAHRMLITATAPPKRAKAPNGHPNRFRDVTVLFGDPTLPDKVKVDGKFNEIDFETIERLKQSLAELEDYRFTYHDSHRNLVNDLRAYPPSFVLNLCDEGFMNDPFKELHVPAILEMLDIPYTGAGPICLGMCYNKNLIRSLAEVIDIPVPMETYYGSEDMAATLPATFPALVKPNFGDSSMGITQRAVVHDTLELVSYMEWLRNEYGPVEVLVQEFLSGPEYSVGIIGNPGLTNKVLPIIEVDYSGLDSELPPILGYESKWLPNSSYWNSIKYRAASLDEEQVRALVDNSSTLFERLKCRDYARFDFRADANGIIKLLEVNPNPGWCWDGKMNMMAGFEGMRYADMLRLILEAARERVESAVPA